MKRQTSVHIPKIKSTSPHQQCSERYFLHRNAGHMVPLSQPPWAQQMLEDFTAGNI